MLEILDSNIKLCGKELDKLKAAAPHTVTSQQRLFDMLLLVVAGVVVYYEMGLGRGYPLTVRSGGVAKVLLPAGYGGIEQAFAVMALAAAVLRVVLVNVK